MSDQAVNEACAPKEYGGDSLWWDPDRGQWTPVDRDSMRAVWIAAGRTNYWNPFDQSWSTKALTMEQAGIALAGRLKLMRRSVTRRFSKVAR